MTQPKLFDLQGSSNAKRVRVTALELQYPLELVPVNPHQGENRKPDYLSRNPMGKIPTLQDGEFVLWESLAIMTYLCAQVPGQTLLPSDPKAHADVLRWLFFVASHIQPWVGVHFQETMLKPQRGEAGNEGAVKAAHAELARFLPVIEQQLATHGGRLCPGFTLAEIGVGCAVERAQLVKIDLSAYPAIQSWLATLQQRPSWKKAG